MTPSTILRKAAERLSKEGAWTQGHLARDARGNPVHPENPDATRWCVGGALIRVKGNDPWSAPIRALRKFLNVSNIAVWQDAPERTQAEVVQALNAAADLAEGDER